MLYSCYLNQFRVIIENKKNNSLMKSFTLLQTLFLTVPVEDTIKKLPFRKTSRNAFVHSSAPTSVSLSCQRKIKVRLYFKSPLRCFKHFFLTDCLCWIYKQKKNVLSRNHQKDVCLIPDISVKLSDYGKPMTVRKTFEQLFT